MKGAKQGGIDWLYEQFNLIYSDMIIRDNPISDGEKPKLRLWIEKNQVTIQKDMLVEFGWQTKKQQEKLDNIDTEDLKKLIDA